MPTRNHLAILAILALLPLPTLAADWREPVTAMAFVQVPAGCYAMGDAVLAQPVHQVCLDSFWLGRDEVTNGQYQRCVQAGACPVPEQRDSGINDHFRTGNEDNYQAMGAALTAPDHPVVGISWTDAQAFVQWLNRESGMVFRLPTEAEWEYACRGGGSGGVPPDGWHDANSQGRTHAAGEKPANGYGLHDMSGNVWEWVADSYDTNAYREHLPRNPLFVKQDLYKVSRGGSWSGAAAYLECFHRGVGEERDRDDNLGFRLVVVRGENQDGK